MSIKTSTVNCQPRVKTFIIVFICPYRFYIFSSVFRFTWFTNDEKPLFIRHCAVNRPVNKMSTGTSTWQLKRQIVIRSDLFVNQTIRWDVNRFRYFDPLPALL